MSARNTKAGWRDMMAISNPCRIGFECPYKAEDKNGVHVCTDPIIPTCPIDVKKFLPIDERICPRVKKGGHMEKFMKGLVNDSVGMMELVDAMSGVARDSKMAGYTAYAKSEDLKKILSHVSGEYELYTQRGEVMGGLMIEYDPTKDPLESGIVFWTKGCDRVCEYKRCLINGSYFTANNWVCELECVRIHRKIADEWYMYWIKLIPLADTSDKVEE